MVEDYASRVEELKNYAKEYNIPIMEEAGIEFLINHLKKHNTKSVLEIGTAIGYSSIMMAINVPDLIITSIERDRIRYLEAVKNVEKFGLSERINLIFGDAMETTLNEKFDLIFLDAAKSQNINFFEHFEQNLNNVGFILTDNMNFHGMVDKEVNSISSRNLRGLIRKLKEYHLFLENNSNYNTVIYHVGDGIAVSSRNEKE